LEGSEGKLAEFVLRGQTTQEVMGLNGRIELWTALGELIAERPFFGHGYLSSRELVVGLISWAREGAYAHNEVAQTLLDFGIVGTLLFWLPFLGALDPGPLRGAALRDTTPAGVVRLRAAVFGAAVFLLLNAMTCEGLVAPGFGLVVCVVLALSAARLRRVRALAPAGLTPPAPRR
ncbi:MAG: O-antigen ligase family protein, partial [Candidatus Eiseniibacteriota bacterium]